MRQAEVDELRRYVFGGRDAPEETRENINRAIVFAYERGIRKGLEIVNERLMGAVAKKVPPPPTKKVRP